MTGEVAAGATVGKEKRRAPEGPVKEQMEVK